MIPQFIIPVPKSTSPSSISTSPLFPSPLPSLPLLKGADTITLLSNSSSGKIPLLKSVFEKHLHQKDPFSSYSSLEHKMRLARLIKVLGTPLLGDTASCRQDTGHVRSLSADGWGVSVLGESDQSSLMCV